MLSANRSLLENVWRMFGRTPATPLPETETPKPAPRADVGGLVEEMLDQGRYALLLRKQITGSLRATQLDRARQELSTSMAIVPAGDVFLEQPHLDDVDLPVGSGAKLVHIDEVFLDRYPVTNQAFRQFVDAGGYGQEALWDPEVWPGVANFVDTTGQPAPRYWSASRFPEGQANHPVVGVNWFEATAFARWSGKRLPTDPEWVKAASWPVAVNGANPAQRRYPWGDEMLADRANVWDANRGKTTPVDHYEAGRSPGGIYDLCGNAWEWTSTGFGAWDGCQYELDVPMRGLRGGAFDTYFDHQASCQFQSGEVQVARRHNIGFRCALGVCEIVPETIATNAIHQEVA